MIEIAQQKPKGMAVAVVAGALAAISGAAVYDCPYKSPGWKSAWLSAYERAKQMELFDGKEK